MREVREEKSKIKNNNSLPKLADSLVCETKNLVREARTEEDLRIGFEKTFRTDKV